MITKSRIRRSVTSALLIAAASIPATAQAKFNLEPGSPPPSPTGAQPIPAPPQPQGTGDAQPGFQWADAGIGAAGATLLLGTGALAYAAPRRRRTLSDSA